eukprot:gene8388-10303_t
MNREPNSSQQLNLQALQRLDNKIVSVIGTSRHVAVYRFDENVRQWFRKEVEGSLFIVKRMEFPYEQLIVLNRLSTKNLVEDISEKLVIKCQGPYLIYKNKSEDINGIWFYEPSDQEKIFNQLKDIQQQPQQPQQQQPPILTQIMQQQQQPQQIQQPQPQQPQQPQPQPQPQQQIPTRAITPQSIPPGLVLYNQQQQQQYIHPDQQQQQPSINHFENNNEEFMKQQPPQSPKVKEIPLLTELMNSVKVHQQQQQQQLEQQQQQQQQIEQQQQQQKQTTTITKEQFKESLKKLLNDDSFISLVYNSYLNELNTNS